MRIRDQIRAKIGSDKGLTRTKGGQWIMYPLGKGGRSI